MFTRSEQLSKQANIKYIHIILDVDVGVKAYHMQWNNNNQYTFERFHALMHIPGAIVFCISWSTYKETLYESRMFQPDFMNTVLSDITSYTFY